MISFAAVRSLSEGRSLRVQGSQAGPPPPPSPLHTFLAPEVSLLFAGERKFPPGTLNMSCFVYLLLHNQPPNSLVAQNNNIHLLSPGFCGSGMWEELGWAVLVQGSHGCSRLGAGAAVCSQWDLVARSLESGHVSPSLFLCLLATSLSWAPCISHRDEWYQLNTQHRL